MVKNNDLAGYRILMIAVAISLAWHIFWLSAVKIVSSPMLKESVRFSKISFLGPILPGVSVDLRAAPAERSFLEKRYNRIAGGAFYKERESAAGISARYGGLSALHHASPALSSVIDEAVSGDKLEPDYQAQSRDET